MSDFMYKIIIFGDGGVGKTTLITRYLTGVFRSDSEITIGVDFHVKKIDLEGIKISLQIWDFAGEERFRFLLPSYVIGASAGIFLYDITRYSSIKNFDSWLDIFLKGYRLTNHQIPVLMVGSKLDLDYKRAVSREDAYELAKKNNLYGYIECSSRTGDNVEEIFLEIGRLMLKKTNLNERK